MICSKFVEICSKTRDDSGNEHKKLFLLKFSGHSGTSNLMFYLVSTITAQTRTVCSHSSKHSGFVCTY